MRSDRRALIVGISSYKVLDALEFADNDALEIYEILSSYNYQFSCELLGSEASAAHVRDRFKHLFVDADENAILIFYFAGHALTVDGGTYFVTTDSEYDIESGVYFQRLIDIVKTHRRPDQVCIFILDCCRAGALQVEDIAVDLNNVQNIVAASTGVTLIAATEEDQLAKEREDLQHGVFTYWLLEGLNGAAANSEGRITVSSLQEYVSHVMAERKYRQRTVYKTTNIGPSPILAEGFQPANHGAIGLLPENRQQEIERETQAILERLERKIRVDHDVWISQNHKEISLELSSLVKWREDLRTRHPELRTNRAFNYHENEIMHLQVKLANLEPGMVVSAGQVIREVGMGGFGTVYAVETPEGTKAYKVYHANQLQDRDKVKAFLRGHGAMVELKGHQSIVRVGELTKAPLGFYMDYIDGPNLRSWWTDDIEKLLTILHIVAQTLDHAHSHSRRIVHRDIKPENILICDSGTEQPIPYLTDFDLSWYSISTVYSSIGQVAAFGHYLYAAPEQYEKPGEDITRQPTTDIYGFGQLCYFSACGSDPATLAEHSIENLKARLTAWHSQEAAQNFVELYKKCIQRTPSNRYQTMNEVSSVLLNIRSLLLDPDRTKPLTKDQFIAELVFSIFGFDVKPTHYFTSKSGRTNIELTKLDPHSLAIRIGVDLGYLAMTGTYEQQRASVNRRIDQVLLGLKNIGIDATRRSERTTSVYNCTIHLNGEYLSQHGVNKVRETILAVIKAVET